MFPARAVGIGGASWAPASATVDPGMARNEHRIFKQAESNASTNDVRPQL
jgi:hypothetical protein